MKLKIYQVDAFADQVFRGNPAAVIPLKEWLSDEMLQNIALENNLSETAFFCEEDGCYHLRWFTPAREVDLCGHATLAAAYVLFDVLGFPKSEIHFMTKSGKLVVKKEATGFVMNFPAIACDSININKDLGWLKNIKCIEVMGSKQDLMIVLSSVEEVKAYSDFGKSINFAGHRGLIVTSQGQDVDFVSRCFYPHLNVEEDPVTGSAHCQLAPYWAAKLNKKTLKAKQLSQREGHLICTTYDDRVYLTGKAFLYLEGEIFI